MRERLDQVEVAKDPLLFSGDSSPQSFPQLDLESETDTRPRVHSSPGQQKVVGSESELLKSRTGGGA